MNQSRRRFLRSTLATTSAAFLLALILTDGLAISAENGSAIQLSEEHQVAVNRRRRIYVYHDVGAPQESFALEPQVWRDLHLKLFDRPDQQVDTIGWCFDEGNLAMHPSTVIPVADFPQIKTWWDAELDIVKFAIEETRKMDLEAFYEYRVNGSDIDFGKDTDPGERGWVLTPMKERHPDWLLPSWPTPKWNFKVPGVREFKVAILRELVQNYDFDGVDLDFSRQPPSLRTGHAWEDRDGMTEFVRAVRAMFQEVAARRGRPLLLAVRVPSNVPGCHYDGYDIETWVEQNLVDIIIPGDRSIDIDVDGFHRIIGQRNIKLIPSLDDYHATKGYRHYPIEFFRGVFSNWWHQGVDGVQTMNFHNISADFAASDPEIKSIVGPHMATAAQEQSYREIGDPQTMRFKDKMFVLQQRWGELGGDGRWDFYQHTNCQAPLPVSIPHDGLPTIQTLYIGDDLAAHAKRIQNIEVRVLLSGDDSHDIEVKVNGVSLAAPSKDADWRIFTAIARQFAVGENLISVRSAGSPQEPRQLSIEKLEVLVDYDEHGTQ